MPISNERRPDDLFSADEGRPRLLGRRALLRCVLTVSAAATVSAVLAACTPSESTPSRPTDRGSTPGATAGNPTRTPSGKAASTHPIPRQLESIPQGSRAPAKEQGTLVELTYSTYESMTYEQKTQPLTKRAITYLPYGYTASRKYNVFYVMHGGWGNETTTLGTADNPNDFKNVLDHAIAAGDIEPLIVVCPTYNNTSPDDSGNFSLALTLTQNYHHELLNDLIPAVEGKYSSYAQNVYPDGLRSSRNHRGFGGFSMGAVATWRAFQYGLDYFRYFLPMSCGTPLNMDDILAAAKNHDRADYFVWVITGTADFAYPDDEDRVELMRRSRYFTEADNEQDGNFAFSVKDGYSHDEASTQEYIYNGLSWFWER